MDLLGELIGAICDGKPTDDYMVESASGCEHTATLAIRPTAHELSQYVVG